MNVVVPREDFTTTIFKRSKGIRANGYIACIFQFLTTLLELLQVGYFVSVFACRFCVSFLYVILNMIEREKGGDIRASAFSPCF